MPGTHKIRYQIFERDNFTCKLCGRSVPEVKLEVDHIIPVANGGSNKLDNLRTTCFSCNRGRGALVPKIHSRQKQIENWLISVLTRWKSWPEWVLLNNKSVTKEEVKSALHHLWEQGIVFRRQDDLGSHEWVFIDKYATPRNKENHG